MIKPFRAIKRPSWAIRRRVIFATLVFCAFEILWITFMGADTAVASTIVLGAFGLAGSTIGSYVFGAVWDDKATNEVEAVVNGAPAATRELAE